MPASIFNAAKEQRRAVGEARGSRVEDTVRRIRPVGRRQNRIARVAMQQRFVAAFHD
jgi:hypothetical protein